MSEKGEATAAPCGGGVSVVFSDLSYSVPIKQKKNKDEPKKTELRILKDLNGAFVPGRMTALMGPSGSGKSTLLDVLAGRKNVGSTSGSVLLNGTSPTADDLKQIVGYVEQFDTLVGELTVYQMLAYTAELKLPGNTTSEQRKERVEEVIQMLDLEACRDTIIGSSLMRGISGGQAKRVNIGLALITRPQVLFLDEPTSGLDSRTANEVVELLHDLAQTGRRTVVCTIHSPTGHAFSRFDDLHMLHGGCTIFDGPLSDAESYFVSLGHERELECSLPEWLVDLTSDLPVQFSVRAEQPEAAAAGGHFAKLYQKSDAKKAADERRLSVESKSQADGCMKHRTYKPPGEHRKLMTLLRYRMVAHYKDGQFVGTRFGDKILFALLILSLYYGIGDEPDPQSILSTANLLYFICAICGYGAAAFVPSLTLERALFYREMADGCYSAGTYYASKFIEESLMAIITSLLFCAITFWACSFQGSFIIFTASYYLTTMMGIILAYAVASVAPTMDAANAILPAMVTIWMYFGGLFIVFDKIPAGWYWFSFTSFLRYCWGAMMLNQFQGEDTGDIPVFFGDDNNDLSTVLEFYGMEGSVMGSIGACLGIQAALMSFFAFIGVLALMFVRHDKR